MKTQNQLIKSSVFLVLFLNISLINAQILIPDTASYLGYYPGGSTELFGFDNLDDTKWLPNDLTGGIPTEIIHCADKYYVYGGRNIIVVDPYTSEAQNRIPVSRRGTIHWSGGTSQQQGGKKMIYSDELNSLYCATENNELVVIDCGSDEVILTFTLGQELTGFVYHDIAYNPATKSIYWLASSTNEKIIVKKYDGYTNSFEAEMVFNSVWGNRLITDASGDWLYVTEYGNSNTKILVLDASDLSYDDEIDLPYGYIVYGIDYNSNLDYLYLGPMYDFYHAVSFVDVAHKIFLYDVQINYFPREITHNTNNNKVYATSAGSYGVSTSSGEVVIIEGESVITYELQNAQSILFNENENVLFCGGNSRIVKISGVSDEIICETPGFNNRGHSTDLAYNSLRNELISVNSNSGHVSFYTSFPASLQFNGIVQTGASSFFGCYNNKQNKIYMIQGFTQNEECLVNIYDGSSNELLNSVYLPVSPDLRSCTYNYENDRIYISGYWQHKVYVIDGGESNSYITAISVDDFPTTVYSLDQSDFVVVGCKNKVDVINAELNLKTKSIPTPEPYPVWINDFVEGETQINTVYAACGSSDKVLKIDFPNSIIEDIYVDSPNKLTYNTRDNTIYAASKITGSDDKLTKISEGSFTVENVYPISGHDGMTDLVYNFMENKVYVLFNNQTGLNTGIGSFNCETAQFSFIEAQGVIEGIVFNPLNNKVYTHNIFNNYTPDQEMRIFAFDCGTDELSSIIGTGNFQSYESAFYFTGYEEIVMNPLDNKIYTGNRGFSNVSIVQCNTEILDLQLGWNWKSFPRMQRYGNEEYSSEAALENIKDFPDYPFQLYSQDQDYYKGWDPSIPSWYGLLDLVQSTSGYKLQILDGNPDYQQMDLLGARIDPGTEMTLYPNQENWMGYFLPDAQYPQDALGEDFMNEHIHKIITHHWTMIKECTGGEEGCIWRTDGNVTPFEYGDCVVLVIDGENEIDNFTWQQNETVEDWDEIPMPDYYSYAEQADYIPFYIEFDSTSAVLEIAIMANDSCYGAAVRSAGDTILEVNGYLAGLPAGAPLKFETWDGYKASGTGKEGYTVMNPLTRSMEKRPVYAGENQEYYVISLKQSVVEEVQPFLSETGCRPNPFTNSAVITFRISETMPVWVEILGQDGRLITTLAGGEHNGGYYEYPWNGADQACRTMPVGIYFWRIRTGSGEQAVGKVVKMGERR